MRLPGGCNSVLDGEEDEGDVADEKHDKGGEHHPATRSGDCTLMARCCLVGVHGNFLSAESTSNIDMISLRCQMSRGKRSFGPGFPMPVRPYKLITSMDSEDLEKCGVKN